MLKVNPLFLRTQGKVFGLLSGLCLFVLCFLSSIAFGQTSIPIRTTVEAIFRYDPTSTEHTIIATTRVSRAVIAAVVGSGLAVAGAFMQALTRNPLASPSVFGINAGALFFIVMAVSFFKVTALTHLMWIGFAGAGIAGMLVYLLGSLGRDGMSPMKIVLAGSAISALFVSFTQGMLVLNEQNLQGVLFWMAGSVAGRTLEMLLPVLPVMAAAGILALLLGQPVNILTSGEDVAKGLGQRIIAVKVMMVVIVIVLAGGSVAIGGSIGFIGLVVPHIVRSLVGSDYRWLVPYCLLYGACLLLSADIAARFIIEPQEMPIGVMTALIGAPFFVYLARRGLKQG